MTALSSELASLSASSQVPHFFVHKLRWNSSIKTGWKLAEWPLLVYILSYRNALCVREESSPHGQVCVAIFSYVSSKLSETSITGVNLPHWHLWRSFSPSLGFLLLMRAMEGEGKPNNSGALEFKLLPRCMKNILGTGMLTSSLSSWWPMANWSSSWSTQVTHKNPHVSSSHLSTNFHSATCQKIMQMAIQAK